MPFCKAAVPILFSGRLNALHFSRLFSDVGQIPPVSDMLDVSEEEDVVRPKADCAVELKRDFF